MKIAHALVVANGEPISPSALAGAVGSADYVLAADGGADTLLAAGVTPDAVLGDFDSLASSLPDSVERIPAANQDYTDLDKAVAFLIERGAERITIVCATGRRLDHTFGTLSVLAKHGRRVPITLLDDFATASLVDRHFEIATVPGQVISLLPLGLVSNITTTGLKWNLTGESLAPGVRDGTSNVATGDEVTINVGAGDLIAYIHHPA